MKLIRLTLDADTYARMAALGAFLGDRDPQLALLYTTIVAAFVLIGGGRYSVDARLVWRL